MRSITKKEQAQVYGAGGCRPVKRPKNSCGKSKRGGGSSSGGKKRGGGSSSGGRKSKCGGGSSS